MTFDIEKKQALSKIDKSRKGDIDEPILPLIEKINSTNDYYTTSSCSGRIMLIIPGIRKNKTTWPFVSHKKIRISELSDSLEDLPDLAMWFRMEHPIIHIACRDLKAAELLLKKTNDSGFRRSSLIAFSNRVIAEIMIPEKMDVPISEKRELLVSLEYIKYLIKAANSKLASSHKKLEKLGQLF